MGKERGDHMLVLRGQLWKCHIYKAPHMSANTLKSRKERFILMLCSFRKESHLMFPAQKSSCADYRLATSKGSKFGFVLGQPPLSLMFSTLLQLCQNQ